MRTLFLAVASAAALSGGACGAGRPDDVRPERALVFDVERGTYRGVQVGDSADEVRERLGRTRCAGMSSPRGAKFFAIGGPPTSDFNDPAHERSGRPWTSCSLRYRGTAVTTNRRAGAWIIVTTDPRAQTDRGVGVGDSAAFVERRYPRATCHPQQGDDADAATGACSVSWGRGRSFEDLPPVVLTFGLDPGGERVRSIWLNVTTPGVIRRMRRRGG